MMEIWNEDWQDPDAKIPACNSIVTFKRRSVLNKALTAAEAWWRDYPEVLPDDAPTFYRWLLFIACIPPGLLLLAIDISSAVKAEISWRRATKEAKP